MNIEDQISEFLEKSTNLLHNNVTHRNLEYELINDYNNIYSNSLEFYFTSEIPHTVEYVLKNLRVILFKCINKINWLRLNRTH